MSPRQPRSINGLKVPGRKAPHRKTRHGCITCKIRRVKCDETKPFCVRCTSTGRKCDGYVVGTPPRRREGSDSSTTNEEAVSNGAVPTSTAIAKSDSQALIQPLSTHHSWQSSELRGFQFYHERMAARLRNFGGASFWCNLIPQGSEFHPAVKHMTVAVASLLESLDNLHFSREAVEAPHALSLEQCNLAIRSLTGSSAPPLEVTLITCALLVWFELLRGNNLHHCSRYLRLGMSMLQKSQDESLRLHSTGFRGTFSTAGPVTQEDSSIVLSHIFAKMETQAIHTGWGINQWDEHVFELDEIDNFSPHGFEELSEVFFSHDILVMICHRIARNISNRTHISRKSPLAKALRWRLSYYRRTYETFIAPNTSTIDSMVRSLAGLNCMTQILVRCFVTANDELVFDRCLPQFNEIVKTFRDLLERNPSERFNLTVLPFHTWLVPPLYLTASFCREPILRREAIRLLCEYPRREFSLDSWTAGLIAKEKMKIEEGALGRVQHCHDVSSSNRIRIHDAKFDPATRHVLLRFSYYPYDESIFPMREQRIKWPAKVNDLAAIDADMVNGLLKVHKLFLKANTTLAPDGILEPMYYHKKLVETIKS